MSTHLQNITIPLTTLLIQPYIPLPFHSHFCSSQIQLIWMVIHTHYFISTLRHSLMCLLSFRMPFPDCLSRLKRWLSPWNGFWFISKMNRMALILLQLWQFILVCSSFSKIRPRPEMLNMMGKEWRQKISCLIREINTKISK